MLRGEAEEEKESNVSMDWQRVAFSFSSNSLHVSFLHSESFFHFSKIAMDFSFPLWCQLSNERNEREMEVYVCDRTSEWKMQKACFMCAGFGVESKKEGKKSFDLNENVTF